MADIAKFIEEIKGMTVLELNSLVKAIEEEFGVSAAAPVAVAGAGAAAAAPRNDFYGGAGVGGGLRRGGHDRRPCRAHGERAGTALYGGRDGRSRALCRAALPPQARL